MTKTSLQSLVCISLITMTLIIGCSDPTSPTVNEDGVPTLKTMEPFDLMFTEAKSGGFDINGQGALVTDKGIFWSTESNPEPGESVNFEGGSGEDDFSVTMTPLINDTEYYVRAYAWNINGIGYGEEIKFKTPKFILEVPCNVDNNSSTVFGQGPYGGVETGANASLWVGDYGMSAHSNSSTLYFGFDEVPITGEYVTWDDFDSPPFTPTCVLHLSWSSLFRAETGQKFYVEKLGEDNYSMTFCDMNFLTSASNDPLVISGNLTTE